MGLFGKKNKDAQSAQSAPKAKEATGNGGRGRQKKSPLAKIFNESVFEQVLEDLRKNKAFIVSRDGVQEYVALSLDVNTIGGLDQSRRKDEAKGSIVECIRSGRILSYITEPLMDENLIVIIPTSGSLAAMEEFSLLTKAQYELCTIDVSGNVVLLDKTVSYKDVVSVLVSDEDISSFMDDDFTSTRMSDDMGTEEIENSVVDMGDDDEEEEEHTDGDTSVDDDIESFEDGDSEGTEDDALDAVTDDDIDSLDDLIEVDASVSEPVSEPASAPEIESVSQEPVVEEEKDVPEQWVVDAVTRKFYSDDLNMEVSTEAFDVQFMPQQPYAPFDENRPSSWINDQLNEMSRVANAELRKLRYDNLFKLRTYFFKLVSVQCDRIVTTLSLEDTDSQYGKMYEQIKLEHEAAVSEVDAVVAKKRAKLEADWKRKLQDIGVEAARHAQHQYKEHYGAQHEALVSDLENQVRAACDADFHDMEQELFRRRRAEAATLLDMSINEVLDELTTMHSEYLADEHARYDELQAQMDAFREENRKYDVARTEAIAEQQRQMAEADRVLAQQTAKMREMSREYATKREELMAELSRMREDNDRRIAAAEKDASRRVSGAEGERDTLRKQYEELMNRYENLDKQKDEQYKLRMLAKDDEIASWKERVAHTEDVQKRMGLMSVFALVTAVIAAVGVGFAAGQWFGFAIGNPAAIVSGIYGLL